MKNAEITAVFDYIAEMLKLRKENIFKIRAYQKVEQLVAEDRLGEAIDKKITELVTTGKLGFYQRLKAEVSGEIHSG